jgi:hypothetical protein
MSSIGSRSTAGDFEATGPGGGRPPRKFSYVGPEPYGVVREGKGGRKCQIRTESDRTSSKPSNSKSGAYFRRKARGKDPNASSRSPERSRRPSNGPKDKVSLWLESTPNPHSNPGLSAAPASPVKEQDVSEKPDGRSLRVKGDEETDPDTDEKRPERSKESEESEARSVDSQESSERDTGGQETAAGIKEIDQECPQESLTDTADLNREFCCAGTLLISPDSRPWSGADRLVRQLEVADSGSEVKSSFSLCPQLEQESLKPYMMRLERVVTEQQAYLSQLGAGTSSIHRHETRESSPVEEANSISLSEVGENQTLTGALLGHVTSISPLDAHSDIVESIVDSKRRMTIESDGKGNQDSLTYNKRGCRRRGTQDTGRCDNQWGVGTRLKRTQRHVRFSDTGEMDRLPTPWWKEEHFPGDVAYAKVPLIKPTARKAVTTTLATPVALFSPLQDQPPPQTQSIRPPSSPVDSEDSFDTAVDLPAGPEACVSDFGGSEDQDAPGPVTSAPSVIPLVDPHEPLSPTHTDEMRGLHEKDVAGTFPSCATTPRESSTDPSRLRIPPPSDNRGAHQVTSEKSTQAIDDLGTKPSLEASQRGTQTASRRAFRRPRRANGKAAWWRL